jgi:hypothetical protein
MQDFCASFMHSLYEVHLNIKLPFFIWHFPRRFINPNLSTFVGGGLHKPWMSVRTTTSVVTELNILKEEMIL